MTDLAKPASLLTPDALRKMKLEREAHEAHKAAAAEMKRAEEEKKLMDTFMAREVQPQAMERVMSLVQKAAERGETQVQLFQFPSRLCNDSGRAINNADPNWPASLEGFPARAFDFFEKNLRPHGYRLRAEILNYPGGVPGDVGVSLAW